jgi:hypothetical protein
MAIKGLDSPVFEGQAMVRALAQRDIGCGLPTASRPWRVAALPRELVGQSQPEVSETLSGRQVQSYEVLVGIAEGLGVSRGAMGLCLRW